MEDHTSDMQIIDLYAGIGRLVVSTTVLQHERADGRVEKQKIGNSGSNDESEENFPNT